MESITMMAAIVLLTLLLWKPSSELKAKEHSVCLDRWLSTWLDGNLNDLLLEGRTIQQCIALNHNHKIVRSALHSNWRAGQKWVNS